jgi:hypothetical protein
MPRPVLKWVWLFYDDGQVVVNRHVAEAEAPPGLRKPPGYQNNPGVQVRLGTRERRA